VLFAWLCRWVPPRRALVTVLALFLGAAPLPYATMMFSHALVVGLLAIAIWAASQNAERGTWSAEPGTSKKGIGRLLRWYRWELLAGFACGWVLASEYSAGLAVVGIFLWLVAFAPTAGVTPGTAFPPDPASAAVGSPVREQRPLALSLSASDAERVAKLGEGDSAWLRVPKRDSGLLVAPTPERTPHPGALPVGRGEAARRADEGNGRMPWIRRMISCLDGARVVAFSVAAIPPLLLIPAYSWACFGDPFTLPYSHQASFPAMKEGLYAIKWPDPATVFNLLFSPTRGLFFWTPFLLMAGFGYRELFDRAPRMFWLTYLVPLVQVLVISGRIWDWQAGPTLGPRLLAPMLPLLALPCALGVARWPRLGAVLGVYSIAITTLATLTDACPSYEIYNPLTELHIPLFLKGEFSPNLGMVLGLPPHASVALYYLILIGGVWWLWWLCGKPRQEVQQGRNHAD